MGWLLALFVLVPAVELALLIEVGSRIGTIATLGLIVLTGIVGASLARWQGFQVFRKVQTEVAGGRLPAGSLVDGLIILIAGALLITPGILTDAVGFLFLVPGFRTFVKRQLWRRFERAVRQQQVHIYVDGGFPAGGTTHPSGPRGDEPDHSSDRNRLTNGSSSDDTES
jgi:UPF0716 protein FxsA